MHFFDKHVNLSNFDEICLNVCASVVQSLLLCVPVVALLPALCGFLLFLDYLFMFFVNKLLCLHLDSLPQPFSHVTILNSLKYKV